MIVLQLIYLKNFYNEKVKAHVHSKIRKNENKKTKVSDCTTDTKNTIEIINKQKTSNNIGLIETIDFMIDFYIAKRMYTALNFQLNWLLKL